MPRSLWANYFDVVILPSQEVSDHAIALSRKLRKYGSKFALGRRQYIPHISLYHLPVRPEHFAEFATTVERVAHSHGGGELRLREIEMPVVMTNKPAWLRKLHLTVVKETTRYFDWKYGAEDSWSLHYLPASLRVQARQYLKRYGSPFIDKTFRPHITLASFEDKKIADRIPVPELHPLGFQVDSIAICELGSSHSCQRIVSRFALHTF